MDNPAYRKNVAERKVAGALQLKGWTVLTSGWPDFLCVKEGRSPRFVEVKPREGYKLKRNQQQVADILERHYNITVEVITPDDLDSGILFL